MENTLNTTHISYIFEYISLPTALEPINWSAQMCACAHVFLFFYALLTFLSHSSAVLLGRLCAWFFRSPKPNEPNRTSNQESDERKFKTKNQSHHPKIYFGEIFLHTCCRAILFIRLFLWTYIFAITVFNSFCTCACAWQANKTTTTTTKSRLRFSNHVIPIQCSFVCFWPMIVYRKSFHLHWVLNCSIPQCFFHKHTHAHAHIHTFRFGQWDSQQNIIWRWWHWTKNHEIENWDEM